MAKPGKTGKQKNRSGAKKRFRLTGKGRFAHLKAAHNHLLQQKSKKAKRLAGQSIVESGVFSATLKRMLPN